MGLRYTWGSIATAFAAMAITAGPARAQTTPIQHVVIIMEENHTFDNYFGDFPGVGSFGISEPPAPDPMPHDLYHGGSRAIAAIDGGLMDNFDPLGQVQYQPSDIPTYWAYAQHFGLGENFFTTAASNSTPNHVAMLAAQTGGIDATGGNLFGCLTPPNAVGLLRSPTDGTQSFGPECANIPSV